MKNESGRKGLYRDAYQGTVESMSTFLHPRNGHVGGGLLGLPRVTTEYIVRVQYLPPRIYGHESPGLIFGCSPDPARVFLFITWRSGLCRSGVRDGNIPGRGAKAGQGSGGRRCFYCIQWCKRGAIECVIAMASLVFGLGQNHTAQSNMQCLRIPDMMETNPPPSVPHLSDCRTAPCRPRRPLRPEDLSQPRIGGFPPVISKVREMCHPTLRGGQIFCIG